MGWIRIGNIGTDPAQQLHSVASKIEVDNKIVTERVVKAEAEATVQHDKLFPIVSRRIRDQDLPFIPSSEVVKRNGKHGERLWVVVDSIVLDVTTYIYKHPGGQQIIQGFGGQECGWQWWTFHDRKVWNEVATTLRVGRTEGIENRHIKPKQFIGLRKFGYQDD